MENNIKCTNIDSVLVNKLCDKPNCDGEMLQHAEFNPVHYLIVFNHKCNKCGIEALYSRRYPYVDFKDQDGKLLLTEGCQNVG